jgi:S-adenosylmethionine synthetase
MSYKKLFTSESVGPGHPDKLCDQISDAILDACLKQDSASRVACEVFVTTNLVVVGGEITTKAKVNYEAIVRETLKKVGYSNPKFGIDAKKCKILNVIKAQSADIKQSIDKKDPKELGAGDQGLMFGYATNETKSYMPWPIFLAHEILKLADKKRLNKQFKDAGPDMKSQVTIDYSNPKKPTIDNVLVSIQHSEKVNLDKFKSYISNNIINEVAKKYGFKTNFKHIVNPSGRFVIGGPEGDTGLTGRKIIVDSYGGMARHGGGAYSGKDATKVDRSAAYMARYIGKNIVAAGLAEKCEVQVSYAIGRALPTSLAVETFGTGTVKDYQLVDAITTIFDLTPAGIIATLDLNKPIYQKLATFGHFGRDDLKVKWEALDQVKKLKKYFNLK